MDTGGEGVLIRAVGGGHRSTGGFGHGLRRFAHGPRRAAAPGASTATCCNLASRGRRSRDCGSYIFSDITLHFLLWRGYVGLKRLLDFPNN